MSARATNPMISAAKWPALSKTAIRGIGLSEHRFTERTKLRAQSTYTPIAQQMAKIL